MAVRIRLTRVGMTKQPTYRFVVTDSRNARDGRSLETLGHYNPRTDPIEINVNEERAKAWLSKGAQPSDTVDRLFRRLGVLPERTDRTFAPPRPPKKEKQSKAEKRAAAPAAAEPAAAPATEEPAAAEEPTAAEKPTATEEPAATEEAPAEAATEEPAAEVESLAAEATTDEPATEVEAPAAEAPESAEAPAATDEENA